MNKTLHRFLCLALVLALGVSLAAPALAAEGGGGSSGSATTEFSFRDHNLSFDPGRGCQGRIAAQSGLAGRGRLS